MTDEEFQQQHKHEVAVEAMIERLREKVHALDTPLARNDSVEQRWFEAAMAARSFLAEYDKICVKKPKP